MSEKSEKNYSATLSVLTGAQTPAIQIKASFFGDASEWHRAKIRLDTLFKMKRSFQEVFSDVMDPRKSRSVLMAMRSWSQGDQGARPPHSQSELELHTERLIKLRSDEFEKLLQDAGLPGLDMWPTDSSSFPFAVSGSDGKLEETFLNFLDKVFGPHLLSLIGSDIDQVTSIEFKAANDAPDEVYQVKKGYKAQRSFPWLAIVTSVCVVWFVYEVWFSGKYTNDGQIEGASSCRAQLERCLSSSPESQWENYCQPRYYQCLGRQ